MKYVFFIFAIFLLSAPAWADNKLPDMNDGPPGCGWRATVTDTHRGDDTTVDLVLMQKIEKCMFNPGPCGTKSDPLTVHVKKDDIQSYRTGQIIKVWVTGTAVSFDFPMCTRNP